MRAIASCLLAIAAASPLIAAAFPQDPVERARRLIDERKGAEAIEILKPVTTPESTNAAAFLALADALRQVRRYGEALAAYRRVEELEPGSARAIAGQAELNARLRDFAAAEAKYRKILDADPSNLEARVGLAWVLSLQRKLDEALAEAQKVVAAKPDHVDGRIRLGWIRLWRHERNESARVFQRIIDERPGHVEAALGLAAAEQANGRVYTAGSILEGLARLHPENVDVLMSLARSRARRGETDAAQRTAKKIVDMQSDHVEALLLLGELALRDARLADGEAHYRKALELEPEDVAARTGVATALRRQGRREEARAVYGAVLVRDPDHINARIGLGWELSWEGNYRAASAEFERVLARDPGNTDALTGLARVRHLEGRWSESQELYDQALAADPWDDAAIEGRSLVRRSLESRARLSYLHAEEFERDQRLELDTLRLVTEAVTLSWRKRISPETAFDADVRVSLIREINQAADDDNYDVSHAAASFGVRHRVADHWTVGARLGAGEFEDRGSGGTWTLPSGETFVEGGASVTFEDSEHVATLTWSRTPLLIKAFPSFDLDVLTVNGFVLAYESPWWKDGIMPSSHENKGEVILGYADYSDGNARAGVDGSFRHRRVFDSGWRVGLLARARFTAFDEDVAFYYSYDRQRRLTIGATVEYEPPGAWSFAARYQATHSVTHELVNPGSHLFDPTQPINTNATTVTVDGHAVDARVAWQVGESVRAGADAGYTWDNDEYITWSAGLYLEVGF